MRTLINIDVDDLDKATRFYECAFRLEVGRRLGVDGVELLGSDAPIYLRQGSGNHQPLAYARFVCNL